MAASEYVVDEGEEEHHSIFALPEHYDRVLMTLLIVALIGVTILYERITEYLEEHVFNHGIRAKLWQKILRELTILGFVSFSATITLQFVHLEEDNHLIFEYAHVLMFTLAIMYAKEIGINSILFTRIEATFAHQDRAEEEVLLTSEREWAARSDQLCGLARLWSRSTFVNRTLNNLASGTIFKVLRFHFMARSGLLGKARFEWASYVTRSMEKQLEEMLEVQVATWILLSAIVAATVRVDLSPRHAVFAFAVSGWVVLLLAIGVLALSVNSLNQLVQHGHVLRRKAKHLIAEGLINDNGVGSSSTGASSSDRTKALRRNASTNAALLAGVAWRVEGDWRTTRIEELHAAVQTQKTPSLMQSLSQGMAALRQLHDVAADDGFDEEENGSVHGHGSTRRTVPTHPLGAAEAHGAAQRLFGSVCGGRCESEFCATSPPGGRVLALLPVLLQTCMLLQCLLQALVVTMLGRDFVLILSKQEEAGPESRVDATGAWAGGVLLAVTLLPTLLQAFMVTPHALRNISLAHAAAHQDRQVLHELETEYETMGDYAAANQALELAAESHLSEEDLMDEPVVRAKVKDLIKLGEMRWRYRVVDEGQSPREEAIKVLDEAKSLVERHCALVSGKDHRRDPPLIGSSTSASVTGNMVGGAAEGCDTNGGRRSSTAAVGATSPVIPKGWAVEMSEVCQGLALARLIFNQERNEDALIASLLKEALALREELRDEAKMAETLNSIGSLRQRQRNFKDAEANFAKSLELRQQLRRPAGEEGEGFQKTQAQAIAQSLTSLGNLRLEMADANDPKTQGDGASGKEKAARRQAYEESLERAIKHLEDAKDMYVKGFSDTHPKTAWALEGLAKAHQKAGHFREAQSAWEAAIAIRVQVQEASTGKQLFSAELEKAQQSMQELSARRASARNRLRNPLMQRLVAKNLLGSSGLGEEFARPLLQIEEPSIQGSTTCATTAEEAASASAP